MGPRPPRPATVQESKAPSFSRPKESVHARYGHSPPHEGVLTPQPFLRKKPNRELAGIVANSKSPMAESAPVNLDLSTVVPAYAEQPAIEFLAGRSLRLDEKVKTTLAWKRQLIRRF